MRGIGAPRPPYNVGGYLGLLTVLSRFGTIPVTSRGKNQKTDFFQNFDQYLAF